MAFTFFFRDMPTLENVVARVVPEIRNSRSIDIWDAGCANGAEPYTLAILLRENLGPFGFRKVRIHATDINGQFADVLARGVYMSEELGRIPEQIRHAYFSESDAPGSYVIDDSLRRRITFRQHDLTTLQPVGESFGLILCKNVLLHLQPERRVEVFRMFRDALSPGGYLGVEQTQKLPEQAREWFVQLGSAPVFQRC